MRDRETLTKVDAWLGDTECGGVLAELIGWQGNPETLEVDPGAMEVVV